MDKGTEYEIRKTEGCAEEGANGGNPKSKITKITFYYSKML